MEKYKEILSNLSVFGKFSIIVVLFICIFVMTQFSLRYVTNIARETDLVYPLPDIYHRALPDSLRKWHEYTDWISFVPLIAFLFFDKCNHLIEFLFLVGVMYLIRAIAFSITVLPSPSMDCKCEWENEPETLLRSILNLIYQEGCNDLIFSGHTSVMLLSTLFLIYYCFPKSLMIQTFFILYNIFGVFIIIGTRLHYSTDCFIATIISTLLFFSFHRPLETN
jgi:shingomyelin synthase